MFEEKGVIATAVPDNEPVIAIIVQIPHTIDER
jgi:hypothetical protein